jgi:hypothetical protein
MAKSNLSRVVEQLRRERERISKRMEHIEVSLAAFGIIRFKGARRTLPILALGTGTEEHQASPTRQKAAPQQTKPLPGRRRIAAAQRASAGVRRDKAA